MKLEKDYLDYLVIELEETIGTSPHSREAIKDILQKAADFGKDKKEPVNEDLEKEVKECWDYVFALGWDENSLMTMNHKEFVAFARHFAEWQKEQMMKNSTDAYIHRNRYTKTNVLHLDVTCDAVQVFKDNDKLKVIFVKED